MPRSSASLASKRSSNNNSGQNGITAASKRQILSRSSSIVVTPSTGASASHTTAESSSSGTPSTKINGILQHRNSAPAGANSIQPNGHTTGADLKVNGRAQSGSTTTVENVKVKNQTDTHKQIDIKPTTSGATEPNLDAVNKTILPSWPLVDSLTLLIILLQLPSTLLSLVYFLFALLSIIPTNLTMLGAVSSSSSGVSSLTSVFLYGYQGGPSVLTIILSDLIMFGMSLFLWPSARSFVIDLAQAVVADSLGAGTSASSTGATKSMGACALVVGLSQIFKDRFRLASIFGIDLDPSTSSTAMVGGLATNEANAAEPGMIRWIFALHIVTQGIVKATRKTLKNNKNITESSATNVTTAGTSTNSSTVSHSKTAGTSISSQQRDTDATNQDIAKSKKGKKQSQWIRNQQPLWAALASTIVHLKEVEKTTATGKSDPKPLEPSSISDEPVVWITKIGATEIEFGSNYHLFTDDDTDDNSDKRFPFYVELNGIKWPQTTISKASENGEGSSILEEGHDDNEWCAEIFGLSPTTEYDISFLRESTGEVIYTTSACTTSKQASVDSQVKEIVPKPTRPLSPLTTLLNSREASQNILEEQKRKLKTAKRANSRKIASLRSEIDTAKSRLGSGDKNDERARRRALSLRDSVRRAEEDAEKFTSDLNSLESLPEDPEEEYKERRREWRTEKDRLFAGKNVAIALKEEADRKIADVQAEVATAIAKRDKANTKMARLKSELERINADNTAAANEEEKVRQRDEVIKRRQAIEDEFSASINKMEGGMNDLRIRTRSNFAALRTFESSLALQQQQAQAQQLPIGLDMGFQTNPGLNTNMPPRSIFGPSQTSPVYAGYPHAFAPTHATPPIPSSSSLLSGSTILQNNISNAFPSSVLYNNRDRSSTYSNDGNIASILHHSTSDPLAMRKLSIPEATSSSYLSDPFMPSVFTQAHDENALPNHGNGHGFYGRHHHVPMHHYTNGEEEKGSQEGSGSSSSRSSG